MTYESFLKPEQKNETYLKKTLAHYLYWRLHYRVVIDEYEWRDIFGIRNSNYSVEFEIKVDKSDFDREINSMYAPQPKTRWGKDWAKWEKHAMYLGKEIKKDNSFYENIYGHIEIKYFIPNEFYFYVPDYLSEHCLKRLENLPYGLVKIGKTSHNHDISYFCSDYEVVKKAVKLHKDKVDADLFSKLAYALTVRSKLLN